MISLHVQNRDTYLQLKEDITEVKDHYIKNQSTLLGYLLQNTVMNYSENKSSKQEKIVFLNVYECQGL